MSKFREVAAATLADAREALDKLAPTAACVDIQAAIGSFGYIRGKLKDFEKTNSLFLEGWWFDIPEIAKVRIFCKEAFEEFQGIPESGQSPYNVTKKEMENGN